MFKVFVSILFIYLLTGCSTKNPFANPDNSLSYGGEKVEDDVQEIRDSEPVYRSTMKSYKVRGKWYQPIAVTEGDTFRGKTSWYGKDFHGKLTSNGERYNMYKCTAASKTLPMNTYLKVENLDNGKMTVVRINDRGPFVHGRIIDLSYQAAKEVSLIKHGVANVRITVISSDSSANKYASKSKKKPKTKIISNKSNNKYFVQIASLYDQSKAIEVKKKYLALNRKHKPLIKRQGSAYRILLGNFKSKSDAKSFIQNSNFKDAFVVRN